MKIILFIRSLGYGGAERQLVSLAVGLKELGHRTIVAVYYPGGHFESELIKAGVSVVIIGKKRRWDVIGFVWRLFNLLHMEKPDILHSYLTVSNIISVLLKLLFPHIYIVWGVRASNMDLSQYDWLSRFAYYYECKLSRFADLIIANSNAGRNYAVKNGFPPNKIVVIHNGIDIKRFYPEPDLRQRVREEWLVSDKHKVVGIVGRLDPMKDYPSFLKAASLLLKNLKAEKKVVFVCVGGGPDFYRQELEKESRNLGLGDRIIWAGARDDMPAVYNAFDVLVLSSSSEGFPNVIGEAMACGVPCVVTDVGDSALIVGDTGIVVPPGSPEKLADAVKTMLDMIDNQGTYLSEAARKRIESNFSIEMMIKNTNEALERLL